jgi:hypothetical protein
MQLKRLHIDLRYIMSNAQRRMPLGLSLDRRAQRS